MNSNMRAFQTVKSHLLSQMQKSVSGKTARCAYRGVGNLKCAVGALIPDNEYQKSFDDDLKHNLKKVFLACPSLQAIDFDVLRSFQGLHDGYRPEGWQRELNTLERELQAYF
jgi:hypothetical protein